MKLVKKDLAVIILSFCIIISNGLNIFLTIQLGRNYDQTTSDDKETLIVGTRSGPTVLDPVDCWESAGIDVIRQVAEPLWYYNLTDINMGRINMLAESEQWLNTTALSVTLRQGVRFHDGTPFNAEAVKWNIDRMLYLTNSTGEMPSDEREATPVSLYKDLLGNPLIASFEVTGTCSGIIHLAQPFSSLMNLMCYASFVMLSPTAHAEEEHSFIDLATGDLVGTGPFEYDKYIVEQEVRFSRWDNYWQDPAMFKKLKFKIIEDGITLNYALLAGRIDYLTYLIKDFFEPFKTSSKVIFYEHQKPGLGYSYLCFNNELINITWRKAMSYAFNYTYLPEVYFQNRTVRAYGPISPSFGKYYDPTIVNTAPYYNLTIARQTIIDDPGINTTGLTANDDPDDEDWLNADLVSFNYSYDADNQFGSDLYPLLREWFDAIGIVLLDDGVERPIYFLYYSYYCVRYSPVPYRCAEDVQLFWSGWGPDYLDPLNMFIPLYSNISIYNIGIVNNDKLEKLMDDAKIELDETKRVEIYNNISHFLAGELYPHIFGFHGKRNFAYSADLYDVPYNSFSEFYAYPIRRNFTYYTDNVI